MLKSELRKEIYEVNKELCTLLEVNNYDLQKPIIISCSQKLDVLIAAYIQLNC